ncbi:MAG: OsmC family protein [Ktedonobacteraceae bacterium]|nr:OsmC family protein [Ktedonobacteraceae bacterium]
MSENLNEYLVEKREALQQRHQRTQASSDTNPLVIRANVKAEGRSGVRRIRIRDFQILSDSGPDFAGYNLGPSSPELQLGVLGSCLTHIFLIQAAERNVPLDSLDVEVTAEQQPRAGQPGYENVPIYPHNISYIIHISSPASDSEIAELHQAVEHNCLILNLLLNPQQINGKVEHTTTEETLDTKDTEIVPS